MVNPNRTNQRRAQVVGRLLQRECTDHIVGVKYAYLTDRYLIHHGRFAAHVVLVNGQGLGELVSFAKLTSELLCADHAVEPFGSEADFGDATHEIHAWQKGSGLDGLVTRIGYR